MENPFQSSTLPSPDDLCGRRQEIRRLRQLRSHARHQLILGTRGSGKTVLLRSFCGEESAPGLTPIYLDALPTEDAPSVAWTLARGLYRSLQWARPLQDDLIGKLLPGLSRFLLNNGDARQSRPFHFHMDLDGIFEAPQKLARERKLRVTVAVDNAHQLFEHGDDRVIQRIRRSMQEHSRVNYVLCARIPSRFEPDRFGFEQEHEPCRLSPIPAEAWNTFIKRQFQRADKSLTDDVRRHLLSDWRQHTATIAGICRHLWIRGTGTNTLTGMDYRKALGALMEEQRGHFESIWAALTANQRRLLTGITLEQEEQALHSGSFLHRYRLSSASSASRARDAMQNQGWITRREGTWLLTEPLFESWIRSQYTLEDRAEF